VRGEVCHCSDHGRAGACDEPLRRGKQVGRLARRLR
jgi:hypothetical protein